MSRKTKKDNGKIILIMFILALFIVGSNFMSFAVYDSDFQVRKYEFDYLLTTINLTNKSINGYEELFYTRQTQGRVLPEYKFNDSILRRDNFANYSINPKIYNIGEGNFGHTRFIFYLNEKYIEAFDTWVILEGNTMYFIKEHRNDVNYYPFSLVLTRISGENFTFDIYIKNPDTCNEEDTWCLYYLEGGQETPIPPVPPDDDNETTEPTPEEDILYRELNTFLYGLFIGGGILVIIPKIVGFIRNEVDR